ncbi:MAG: hypothetical protein QX203_15810 [Methylococcaceae bacterium]
MEHLAEKNPPAAFSLLTGIKERARLLQDNHLTGQTECVAGTRISTDTDPPYIPSIA